MVDCSDAQIMPLSNVLECMMELTASFDISGFVNDRGRVASADAQRRLAGGVRRLDHAGAAGGEDDVGFLHHHVGQLQRGNIDPRR